MLLNNVFITLRLWGKTYLKLNVAPLIWYPEADPLISKRWIGLYAGVPAWKSM